MNDEEIASALRTERNRLRREMEKYAAANLQDDPTGAFSVGILEGMSLAIRMLTKRIHELETMR